jgi:hypothetical protein
LSFYVSFFLHFAVLAQRRFPNVSSPFFACFALKAKQCGNREIGGITKMSPIGDKIGSPLANGYLLMCKSPRLVLAERG